MRIGIDATGWANERGHGRFTRELVTAMAGGRHNHQFVCLLDSRMTGAFPLTAPNVRTLVVPQSTPFVTAGSPSHRSISDTLRLTAAVRQARFDAFLSPSVTGYFPLPPGLPAVVTVHDAIAERSEERRVGKE